MFSCLLLFYLFLVFCSAVLVYTETFSMYLLTDKRDTCKPLFLFCSFFLVFIVFLSDKTMLQPVIKTSVFVFSPLEKEVL